VKKTVPTESFFNFFDPPKAPVEDDDAAASDIDERLELDYQLGEDIKEKLIPRAVDWFTGEALQFEELDDDMEGGDFEDEDDEEDDDLSEERDDEEESDEEVSDHPILFRPFYRLIDTNAYLRMIIRSLNRKQQNASRARLGLRYILSYGICSNGY
jgi:nucleosome assembly protein 1-like 1